MSRRQDLTSSPVGKKLFALSVPMFVGVIAFGSIDLVDLIFIARLGEDAVSAVGFGTPLMAMGGVLIGALGTAVNSMASRAYGASDDEKLRAATLHGIMLGSVGAFLLSVLALVSMDPVLSRLGANADLSRLAQQYLWIWYVSFPVSFLPATCGSALAGIGDTKTPMLLFVMAAVINLLLDPILIFGIGPIPALGLQGAALASAVAKGFAGIVALAIVLQHGVLSPYWQDFSRNVKSIYAELVSIAFPVVLSQAILPISAAAYTYALAPFGAAAVASATIGSRIRDFTLQVPNGLGMGLAPLVGQNWGAGLRHRVKDALALTEKICLGWGVLVWLTFAVGGTTVAAAFVKSEEATDILHLYMLISMAAIGPRGAFSMGMKTLNAIGDSRRAMIFSVASAIVSIVMVLLVPQGLGVGGVFAAVAFPSVIFALILALYLRRVIGSSSATEILERGRKDRTKEVTVERKGK